MKQPYGWTTWQAAVESVATCRSAQCCRVVLDALTRLRDERQAVSSKRRRLRKSLMRRRASLAAARDRNAGAASSRKLEDATHELQARIEALDAIEDRAFALGFGLVRAVARQTQSTASRYQSVCLAAMRRELRDAPARLERLQWIEALRVLPAPGAVHELRRCVADDNASDVVRASALQVLWERASKEGRIQAIRRLASAGAGRHLACSAIEILRRGGTTQDAELLIDLLRRDVGIRVHRDAHEAIVALTHARVRPTWSAWRAWWDTYGPASMSARPAKSNPPARTSSFPGPRSDFFGVPVGSAHVLFLLDNSESMAPSWPRAVEGMRRAIERLDERVSFNVHLFGNGVRRWMPAAVRASAPRKRAALAWLQRQDVGGVTVLRRPLRQVFIDAALHDDPPPIDTVFLLSDGRIGDTERIVQECATWNRHARVRVHCVFAKGTRTRDDPPDLGRAFLVRLAQIGQGTTVDME